MSEFSLSDELVQQLAHPLLAEIDDLVLSPHRSLHRIHLQVKTTDSVATILDFAKELAEILRIVVLDRSTFRKHVILKLAVQTPFDIVLAAVSVGLFLAAEETPPCFELEVAQSVSSDAFIARWRQWCELSRLETALTALERRENSFAWICEDTSELSRLQRLACAAATLRHGYSLLKKRYDSISKSDVVSGTELIVEGGDLVDRSCSKNKVSLEMAPGSRVTQLDIAAKWVEDGFKVAAVNSASSFQVCGGFLTGAASALEESMCMQSTLFFSLHKAQRLAEKRNITDACGRRVHVPECGVVVSPCVHIFRRDADHGYAPRSVAEVTAVLSVSMPNRNSACTDCPLETRTGSEFEILLEQKFQALLWGTVRSGAKILIMPEIGCGILGNDPAVVGKALGKSLQRFEGLLDRVVVMGRQQFYNSVRSGYAGLVSSHSSSVSAATDGIASNVAPPLQPSFDKMTPAQDTLPNLIEVGTSPNMVNEDTLPNLVDADTASTQPNLVNVNPALASIPAEENVAPEHISLKVTVTADDKPKERSKTGMMCISSCFAPPSSDLSRYETAVSAPAISTPPPPMGIADETPVRPINQTRIDLVPARGRTPALASRMVANGIEAPKTRVDLAHASFVDGKSNGLLATQNNTHKTRVDLADVRRDDKKANGLQVTRVDLPTGGNQHMDVGQGTATVKTATGRLFATHNSNPQRTECARQLGLEIQAKAAKYRDEASDVFQTLDVQKTGSIPCSRLHEVLPASRGKKPSGEELSLLLEGFHQEDIPVDNLLELMRAWELYEVFKDDIDLLFYLYDGDSTGHLDIAEVMHVIKELSGNQLSDAEIEAIIIKIKLSNRSSTSRREFAMAVAKWQALTPQHRQINRSSVTKKSDWDCTLQ